MPFANFNKLENLEFLEQLNLSSSSMERPRFQLKSKVLHQVTMTSESINYITCMMDPKLLDHILVNLTMFKLDKMVLLNLNLRMITLRSLVLTQLLPNLLLLDKTLPMV